VGRGIRPALNLFFLPKKAASRGASQRAGSVASAPRGPRQRESSRRRSDAAPRPKPEIIAPTVQSYILLGTWKSAPQCHYKMLKSQLTRVPPAAKPRDFATAANCHQCRAGARHAACTWSRRCRARPNVETLQSCKRTACPGSGKCVRIAGIATFAAPLAASCAAPLLHQAAIARPRVRRARTDVGTSQACAHAARTGAGNTPESPEDEVVGGEGRSG